MTLKELNDRKKAAEAMPKGSKEQLKALLSYHNDAAEYWDGRIGSTYNDDDKCTANWNKHCKGMDEAFNALQKLERASQMKVHSIEIDSNFVRVYLSSTKWISFQRFGTEDLYCGSVLSEASCELFKDQARVIAEAALKGGM